MLKPHSTIQKFEPKKYEGLWYESAKIPTEKWDDYNWATANYKWDEKTKTMSIINTYYTNKGKTSKKGTAFATKETGKLKTTFEQTSGYKFPYWIHFTDYETFSIVGGPTYEYLWVLSRTPNLLPDIRMFVCKLVIQLGYNIGKLKWNYIPNPKNLEVFTVSNTEYRYVLQTTPDMQLALMSLDPGEYIPTETHKGSQFIRVESGIAKLKVNGREFMMGKDEYIIIPSGYPHYVANASKIEKLKLYSIYSPPEHSPYAIKRRQNY